MKQLTLMISAALLVLSFTRPGFAQVKANNLILSISTDEMTFTAGRQAKVRARVENKTGQVLKTGAIPVSFHLSIYGRDLGKCRYPDCFVSYLAPGKEIENGGTLELEVDLVDLHWKNLIASGINLRRPENMFEVITTGKYQLFMAFQVPDKQNSTEGDPGTITITSNEISVMVEGSQ
jgi:hypothetical protein